MTGPAFVRTVDLQDEQPSEVGLGPLYVPICREHRETWAGPSTRDPSLAATNVRIHNTDRHRQTALFDLDTQETR